LYLNIAFVLGKVEKIICRPTAKYSLRENSPSSKADSSTAAKNIPCL
jgi:hypothetical protein